MIAMTSRYDRYEDTLDETWAAGGMERFTYRSAGEFPVRSHSARTRGKMRSRGHGASRRKVGTFNGVNRRGHKKLWSRMS